MSSSGDWRPPPDRFFGPLDRATKRPSISIKFKCHLTQGQITFKCSVNHAFPKFISSVAQSLESILWKLTDFFLMWNVFFLFEIMYRMWFWVFEIWQFSSKLSVHITNPLFMYYFSLLQVLLLLNLAIFIWQYFPGVSFSTQWELNFAIQAFSTSNYLNFSKISR